MILTVTLPVGVTILCPRAAVAGGRQVGIVAARWWCRRAERAARSPPGRAARSLKPPPSAGQISAPLSVQQSTGRSCAGLQLFPRLAGAAVRGAGGDVGDQAAAADLHRKVEGVGLHVRPAVGGPQRLDREVDGQRRARRRFRPRRRASARARRGTPPRPRRAGLPPTRCRPTKESGSAPAARRRTAAWMEAGGGAPMGAMSTWKPLS